MTTRRKRTQLGKDARRKHHYFMATIFYRDGERFSRIYTSRDKAKKVAERQQKSPMVKMARVAEVG